MLVLVACSSGGAPPEGDPAGGTGTPQPASADEAVETEATAAVPPPAAEATAQEIKDICKVYRKALRGRWDDERTRGEIRGLSLSSAAAASWREELVSGDPTRALDASRAVVTSAGEQGLGGICEPLAGLVALAEAMQSADSALRDDPGSSVPQRAGDRVQ